jgi:ribonucleotide monophosphatase NagD (HAD superfamily)
MYGSAYVAAQYLKELHAEIDKVRVVGMNSICEELKRVGIDSVGGEGEIIEATSNIDFMSMEVDRSVKAVIVGLDTKFTYNKLAMANVCIQAGKAKFFATNDD